MIVTELICGGVLLSALAVIGAVASRSQSPAEETSAIKNDYPDAAQNDVNALRAIHQVSLVPEKDEGTSAYKLPLGTYGFSWAPQAETPVFRKRGFQSFEVHHDAEGEVHIIGFVTADDAKALSNSNVSVSVRLYPQPYEQASVAVSVQKTRISDHKGPERENGNPLKLKVEPSQATVQ